MPAQQKRHRCNKVSSPQRIIVARWPGQRFFWKAQVMASAVIGVPAIAQTSLIELRRMRP